MITDAEAAALLRSVGHTPLGIRSKTPLKHRYECGCGYVSTYRATYRHAVEGGIHHMRKEAAILVANGVSVPEIVGPPLQDVARK